MELKPGQKCQRCSRLLENQYCTIYNEKGEVKEIICPICNYVEYLDDYKKSGVISTRLMMEAGIAKYYHTEVFSKGDYDRVRKEYLEFYLQNKKPLLEVAESVEEVKALVSIFEDFHWLPYIKKYWNGTTKRGHEASLYGTTILMWGCAGRVLITAQQANAEVTMIFSDYVAKPEDIEKYGIMESRGGIQGISATKQQAIDIMNTLNKAKKIKFHPKESVRMAGL